MSTTAAISYPSVEQVQDAGIEAVLRWNRFLPSPRTEEQLAVINSVVNRLSTLRASQPGEYVRASKRIGWRL